MKNINKMFFKISLPTLALALVLGGFLVLNTKSAEALITTITVTAPNGTEKWSGTKNITWTSDGVGGDSVDIYYCHVDNGDCDNLT